MAWILVLCRTHMDMVAHHMAAEEMLRIQVEMEMEMEMEVKATISHFSRNQPTQPIQLMPPKAADFLLCLDMALRCRTRAPRGA